MKEVNVNVTLELEEVLRNLKGVHGLIGVIWTTQDAAFPDDEVTKAIGGVYDYLLVQLQALELLLSAEKKPALSTATQERD